MRHAIVVSVLALLTLAGCGGKSRDAAETARAWVHAVNAENWKQACELSVGGGEGDCVAALSAGFKGMRGELQVGRMREEGDDTLFALESSATEQFEKTRGWTAYAPIELLVERHEGEHLVHFEVAVIN